MSRRTPRRASSWATYREAITRDKSSLSAAEAKLPQSTTVVKTRMPEKGKELARATGATYKEIDVARDADLVIVATGYADAVGALRTAGNLDGKIVVDITNPLNADYTGLTVGFKSSAAEELQKAFPGSRVVKASIPSSHRCSRPVRGSAERPFQSSSRETTRKRARS